MAAMVTRYQQVASFRPERFNPVAVAETEKVRVLVVSFEAGQFIPLHRTGADMTLTVMEGEGALLLADREEPISPGTVAFVPAGEARGVRADTRLVTLQVVAPPPGKADHAEVESKLQKGTPR